MDVFDVCVKFCNCDFNNKRKIYAALSKWSLSFDSWLVQWQKRVFLCFDILLSAVQLLPPRFQEQKSATLR